MSIEYFRVREIDRPDQNGIVVALEDGGLETIAGGASPSQFGCSLDDNGNIRVDKGYFSVNITPEEADKLKESYIEWEFTRGYVSTDSSVESVLVNTLGTVEFSGGRK